MASYSQQRAAHNAVKLSKACATAQGRALTRREKARLKAGKVTAAAKREARQAKRQAAELREQWRTNWNTVLDYGGPGGAPRTRLQCYMAQDRAIERERAEWRKAWNESHVGSRVWKLHNSATSSSFVGQSRTVSYAVLRDPDAESGMVIKASDGQHRTMMEYKASYVLSHVVGRYTLDMDLTVRSSVKLNAGYSVFVNGKMIPENQKG